MRRAKLPEADSVQKLAEFWQKHDLSDFEEDLEMVNAPVFVRDAAIQVRLSLREAKSVGRMAQAEGVSQEELIRAWVLQKVPAGKPFGKRSDKSKRVGSQRRDRDHRCLETRG